MNEVQQTERPADISQAKAGRGMPLAGVRMLGMASVLAAPMGATRNRAACRSRIGGLPAPHAVPCIVRPAWSPPRTEAAVGEHKREILRALGLTDEQMAQTRRDGVI